jgi:hypothetical protein
MTEHRLNVSAGLMLDAYTEQINADAADIESMTVEEAARALRGLRRNLGIIRQVEAGLERWIAECFAHEKWRDPHELPGVGMVEVKRSKDRKAWDHEALKSRWLNAYTASTGGEVTDPAEVRDALLNVVSIAGWKVTGLRELDIDADDYCSSLPGTPRVVLS